MADETRTDPRDLPDPRDPGDAGAPGDAADLPADLVARLAREGAVERAAAAAAYRALAAADPRPPPDGAVLWVAMEGGCGEADRAFWETAHDHGGALASPGRFSATLPSSLAGDVARVLGLTGPVIVAAAAGPGQDDAPAAALAVARAAGLALLLLAVGAEGSDVPGAPRVRCRLVRDPGGETGRS